MAPTGRVFVPYPGEMRVSGMAPETARARIEERLFDIIPSAQVQLVHRPGRANSVSRVGGVRKPGPVPLEGRDLTVSNLLSMGGGVSDDLANPQITRIRDGALYRTSVQRLFDEPALDTSLRGGDKIIVGEDDRYFLSRGGQAGAISVPAGSCRCARRAVDHRRRRRPARRSRGESSSCANTRRGPCGRTGPGPTGSGWSSPST